MARLTLDRMAAGGMYDLLGGGFHRYSVDGRWLVPHFEKMLYDNALLASAYLHAWVVTGEERYRRVTDGDAGLRAPRAAAARGRASPPRRTRTPTASRASTFTWTAEEIEAVLGEPHPEWLQPFEHGRSVLRGEIPEDAREALLAARERPARSRCATTRPWPPGTGSRSRRSPRPGRGSTGPTTSRPPSRSPSSSSGRSRTSAGGSSAPTGRATPASTPTWRTTRTSRTGSSSSYVGDGRPALARGGAAAGGAPRRALRRPRARRLLRRRPEGDGLVARRKEFDDHPTPSGNSMAAFVLLRLARIYGDDELERLAVGVFRLAHPLLERAPAAVSHLLCALDLHFSRRRRRSRSSATRRSCARPRSRATGRTPSSRSSAGADGRGPPPRGQGPRGRQPGRLRLRALRLPAPVTTAGELRESLDASASPRP